MFLVMAFMSRYITPSAKLIKLYESWMVRFSEKNKNFKESIRLLKVVLTNFRTAKTAINSTKLCINWPPSIVEI